VRKFGSPLLIVLVAVMVTGCAHNGDAGGGAGATSAPTPATSGPPPIAVAATVAGPLTGGTGISLAAAGPGPDLGQAGYQEAEYVASGTATSYKSVGDLPQDGTFHLSPDSQADYTTRLVVRRPADPAAFNGVVLVEWLNVSGGVDAGPDYTYLTDEILRRGYAWVGVSAQRIGVEGGPVAVGVPGSEAGGAGKGLKAIDPARYGALHHPGDAYAYDIYTQVAQALRSPGSTDPLAGLGVQRVLALGESQSAFTLTTYYDGVQPLTHEFDGFFIHSRGGAPAPLSSPSGEIDIVTSLSGRPTTLRTDQPTPAIVIETETDVLSVLGFYPARQPDNDHLRVWEVAGTAHADQFQIGPLATSLGCGPINNGQQVYVLRAALRHLDDWVSTGAVPPRGTPLDIDVSTAKPTYRLDRLGNVKGGVRTPALDAPVDMLSGIAPNPPSIICLLLGTTTPLSRQQLDGLYSSKGDYLTTYTAATDAAIAAGFALPEDRTQILQGADPTRFANS
jgi:hypothetical protein